MKVTAKAPANIAFIKYWGKKDARLRIPMNSSISMNLSRVFTTTSVEFDEKFKKDKIMIDGKVAESREEERVVKHLDRVRRLTRSKLCANVISKNNFPRGTGIASSASGFAALTLAATKAFGLGLSERELSILARVGSGSACRSVPDGFVEWKAASTSEGSYAHSLYPSDYWDICDVVAIVGEKSKKVSSTEGHALVESSPFYRSRIAGMGKKIAGIKKALKNRNFTKFGEIVEAEAINMHSVMMTSRQALYYWLPETLEIMLLVVEWRGGGLESYFTIDAGPNVHVICRGRDVVKIKNRLSKRQGVKNVIVNKPTVGARLI